MSRQEARHSGDPSALRGTLRRARFGVRCAALAAALMLAWSIVPWRWGPMALVAISPLVALCAALATRALAATLLVALPVLLLVLAWRRWFCRWLCPTGLLSDQLGRLGLAAGCRPRPWPRLGLWIAVVTMAGACLGYPLLLWLDPLALFAGAFGAGGSHFATASALASIAGLMVVMLVSLVSPGTWCTCLCPLGATQDLLARLRHSLARHRVAGREHAWPLARRVVLASGLGVIGALAARQGRAQRPRPLRPPGAVDEWQFAGVCVRCGNCLRACPSGILQADLGGGLTGFMAPLVRFESGYCLEDCCRCGEVCPSGALARFALPEKPTARIGVARVDMGLCLLSENRECGICRNCCPYEAIATVWDEEAYTLVVKIDPGRCPGCGACQVACPTAPAKAIVVTAEKPPASPGGGGAR